MTICLATDSFPPHNSGIATHNAYLARILKDYGNKLVVLTADFDRKNEPDEIEDSNGITIVRLKKSYSEQHAYFSRFIRNGNREAVVWLSLGMAMRKWMLENQTTYQIELVEFSDYGGFGLFLLDENLPPAVAMCHGMLTQLDKVEFHNQDENLSLIRFLETNAIQQADAVICHSQSNAADLARDFGIRTIYAQAPWQQDMLMDNQVKKNVFLVASRLQVCKGALVLAKAMDELRQVDASIKILWIGEDTYTAPEGYTVSKYIRKHFPQVWQKNFTWKKALPRKPLLEEMEQAKAVIIPSTWETFNYVALEAANRKKPLLITRQAGIAELFHNGEEVILADANDSGSLVNGLQKINGDPGLAARLGSNLFESMQKQFTTQKCMDDRTEAYRHAMEQRNIKLPNNPLKAFFNF